MSDTPETHHTRVMRRDQYLENLIVRALKVLGDDGCIYHRTETAEAILERFEEWEDFAGEIERKKLLTLRSALEYIANAGITARHCEDVARKTLALIDPTSRYEEPGEEGTR